MKTRTKGTLGVFFVLCFSVLLIVGCASNNKGFSSGTPQAAVVDTQPEPAPKTVSVDVKRRKTRPVAVTPDYYHTVKWNGETLAHIAKWYTGKFKNWRILAKANPSLNPNKIYKGNRVVIPESVLKTRKPLPKNFHASLKAETTKKSSVEPSPDAEAKEPFQLFGPKDL